ncbi:antibiotic biosynthesis monooxygenase [Pseudomonas coronafaciens]|uniref:ABM domain-containing protein n=1 Tax=Pseudomonas coronafaciens pv. striafaciens TaxID=235276 RepID=A0A3M4YC06_9PSED|nr:antibiotic biosynthesis monooxygenase [Pseudomonas coronafaciens]RMR86250.1 hypothetical protein ALP78_02103 [Pseudomonas coronafaciens pv. striafaciens]
MLVNAVSTLQIEGLPGMSTQLEKMLSALVPSLGELPGCLSYDYAQTLIRPQDWIVMGRWSSQLAM